MNARKRSSGSQGRRRPSAAGRRRQLAKRTLILTEGEKTEVLYFKGLRKSYPDVGSRIEVEHLEESVQNAITRAFSAYEAVWLVLDQDAHSEQEMLRWVTKAKKRKGKKAPMHFAFSRPCFEVWLLAHYAKVRPYQDQKDAALHYRSVATPTGPKLKGLPTDFDFSRYALAAKNCSLDSGAIVGELPGNPGSQMPALLEEVFGLSFER